LDDELSTPIATIRKRAAYRARCAGGRANRVKELIIMRHAVIMAGGSGKRLWPLSRTGHPKQILPIIGGKNLLEMCVERLEGLFEKDNIWVITCTDYADRVAEALPQIPPEHIVGEPEGRDTANAIALAAALLEATDPDGTMAVFTADHVIRPVEQFADAVRAACDAAEKHPDSLVTFGIRPTWPHTGLGYVHCGSGVTDGVHEVVGFKEKPDHQTARRYVDSGQYFWNSGMFVWKVSTIRDALAKHLPDSQSKLRAVTDAVREGADYTGVLAEVYPSLEGISIDYAVMERYPRVLMVELNCEWVDVGAWPALAEVCEPDESGNVVVAENVTITDSFRNVIVSQDDHLLAVLGMDDCVIVHAPDATLVCRKSDAQRIKDLVKRLVEQHGRKYL